LKKFLVLFSILSLLLTGCASSWTPVASIDDFASRSELDKPRNWQKQTQARIATAGALGGSLVLAPIGFLIAMTYNETGMTIKEIAQAAAYQTFDQNNIIGQRYVAYTDGYASIDYWVAGRQGNIEGDTQAIALTYLNQDKDLSYYEAWMVKKDGDKYYGFSMPVLEKKGNDVVYTFDRRKKITSAKNAKAGLGTRFGMQFETVDETGKEGSLDYEQITNDFRAHYNATKPQMALMNCIDTDSCHPDKKEKEAAALEKTGPSWSGSN